MTSIILISLCLHLQSNLDDMMLTWNHHRIRPYRDMNGPVGKPVVLFHAPETVGFRNQMKHVGMQQLQICRQESSRKPSSCEETVHEICCIAMIENGWNPPSNASQAEQLYLRLRHLILSEIDH